MANRLLTARDCFLLDAQACVEHGGALHKKVGWYWLIRWAAFHDLEGA